MTGSEALAIHGLAYRATNDIDIVLDVDPTGYESIVRPVFQPEYLVNPLVRVAGTWLGSAIHVEAVGKADFVVRDADPWGQAAFGRRARVRDEGLGDVWISTRERAATGRHLAAPRRAEDVVGERLATLMRAHGYRTEGDNTP